MFNQPNKPSIIEETYLDNGKVEQILDNGERYLLCQNSTKEKQEPLSREQLEKLISAIKDNSLNFGNKTNSHSNSTIE